MYKIQYGADIKIFFGEVLSETHPIGIYHTAEFAKKREQLQSVGIQEILDFNIPKPVFSRPITITLEPRDYQLEVLEKTSSQKVLNGIVKSPTRSGKTFMMALTIAEVNMSTIIVFHSTKLTRQTEKAFIKMFGLDQQEASELIGVLADDRKEIGRPILLCNWQSLQNKASLKKVMDYGYNMVFGDEVHRASAEVLSSLVQRQKSQKKIGFSASVYKLKEDQEKKLHDTFGPVIHKVPAERLYAAGHIVRPTFYRIPTGVQVSITTGIRMYYRQKVEKNHFYRKVLINEIERTGRFKSCIEPGRTRSDVVFNPLSSEIDALISFAVSKLDEADKENQDLKSIKIGIAKKGIDFNQHRLQMIIDTIEQNLSKTDARAAVAFNLVATSMYVYHELKKRGYENLLLLNSKNTEDDAFEKIKNGEDRNYIILTTYQYFAEGHDIPSLEDIVAASPYYPPFVRVEAAEQLSGRGITPDPVNSEKRPRVYFIEDTPADKFTLERKQLIDELVKAALIPNEPNHFDRGKHIGLPLSGQAKIRKK